MGNFKSSDEQGTYLGNNIYTHGVAISTNLPEDVSGTYSGSVLFDTGVGFWFGRVNTTTSSTTVNASICPFCTYVLNIQVMPVDVGEYMGSTGPTAGFGHANLDKYGSADWDNYDIPTGTSSDHDFKILTYQNNGTPGGIGYVDYFCIIKHDYTGI
jgi:hypothetical protein